MKNHNLLNLLLFTCFLVIGNFFSTRIYQSRLAGSDDTLGWITIKSEKPVLSLNNGQQSILLIGVDSLDSVTPHLESIWLVSYLPNDPVLYILPVLPSSNEKQAAFENELVQTFNITGRQPNGLNKNFISILKEANYWWSGYIIFDQTTMRDLAKELGQDKGYEQKGILNHTAKPSVDEYVFAEEMSSKQFPLIRTACERLSGLHEISDQAKVITFFSTHVLTDLDVSNFIAEWNKKLSTPQSQYCRYPTTQSSVIDE